ncbi:MAG: FtsW/RodA/SpoVE family cell cycle protein [[Lactobacillus] timonensis]|nr:FtsW/RodA/SpoVE family cell cycle protein [[Lactobacillus] timonensis]
MVYSASAGMKMQNGVNPRAYFIKQLFYVLAGLICFIIFSSFSRQFLRSPRFLGIFFLILFVMLVYVRLRGQEINGARGWLHIGPINIQPAEMCKLFLILYLSNRFAHLAERGMDLHFKEQWGAILIVAALLVLIIIQPDIGGFAINSAIVIVIIVASGMPVYVIVAFLGISVFLIGFGIPLLSHLAVNMIHGYQAARFLAYLDPFQNSRGIGSQLVNSYYAISNGGLHGVGLGNSIQKMGFLPEPNTDFIMSILAEEFGFLGVLAVLALLAMIILRTVRLGVQSQSMYETLTCYGTATFITVETLFNVGGVTGILPITGVTFPFISYGGSSMIILCASLGLVENIAIRRHQQRQHSGQEEW